MKKIILLIVALVIVVGIVWRMNSSSMSSTSENDRDNATTSIPTSNTVVVSSSVSEYKNDELGFSIKYPTIWEKIESPTNVNFVIPVDPKEKTTIGNLEVKVDILSGKCSFPPVTTVKERTTLAVGDLNFNMISIANTIQSRSFFNRMYSLQQGSVCYFFTFSSIVSNPASKGFAGTDIQKVSAKNTKLVDAADSQFKDMIKSFKFVVGPAGQDETKASPKK